MYNQLHNNPCTYCKESLPVYDYYYTIFYYSQTYTTPGEHIHISHTLSFYFRVF